ncbi:sialate O-acetylesterase [Mucilaginibacter pocheonensis]|uniref:Sialate O-acetylesterase n=1 Tax=Mucilaginibacter pocheonensis TaxID=398050 RepID=A0ABU1T8A0_9SPHI|nr:sialate O-acetylesterase [Mucilaginibacter pocheonensis]MDR6941637.1 sialate O-acetylesterase [Mucilaginibacter pocheonensis]
MKFFLNRCLIVLLSGFCFALQTASATVRLPKLISDGMILQRDTKLKIWGWATAGEQIKIKFNNKTGKVVTSKNGEWSITFPAMKAGGPYTMDIMADEHLVIRDILIGDVWFCSGQSNMVLPMERVKEKYPDEIAAADYPQVRNFFIPTMADVTKLHDDLPGGKWLAATPANVLSFGAAAYFFAKQIYLKHHIPIGLINSSVGGTPIEAWVSEAGLKQFPLYQNKINKFKDTAYVSTLVNEARAAAKKQLPVIEDKGLMGPQKWYDTAYVPQDWHKFWLPGYWADQGVKGLNGIVWFRKEIDVPADMAGKLSKLFMGRIVDADQAYVNGVLVGAITYQYPPRRYTLPPGTLKPGKNVIVVKVVNTAGKGGFVPDKPYYLQVGDQKIDLRGDWKYKVGQVFDPGAAGDQGNSFSEQMEPAGLYNTMVTPVVNYSIKGILWYQGEANTKEPRSYQNLLPALINDWRSKWRLGDIPFIYAQLPNFMEVRYSPAESQWAELREGQRRALRIVNTGMAVTIDAGEWNDIHPLNKKAVGDRLALAAEKLAYHNQDIIASGPLYKSFKIDNNKVIISFDNAAGGLTVMNGGELAYFAIAGKDKKYVWAQARISGDTVIVWSDKVPDPLYVRYAWADNPEGANLYNREGLPASPFTTDTE